MHNCITEGEFMVKQAWCNIDVWKWGHKFFSLKQRPLKFSFLSQMTKLKSNFLWVTEKESFLKNSKLLQLWLHPDKKILHLLFSRRLNIFYSHRNFWILCLKKKFKIKTLGFKCMRLWFFLVESQYLRWQENM